MQCERSPLELQTNCLTMKLLKAFIYRHCCIRITTRENHRLGTRYDAYLIFNDHTDRLKQSHLCTLSESCQEILELKVKEFINALPYSMNSLIAKDSNAIDWYKKFIRDKTELINRYQYKGYWVEMFTAQDPDKDKYFLYQPCVELPNGRGTVTGGKYDSVEEAEFATVELIESWN
jgi:hypothetical protein